MGNSLALVSAETLEESQVLEKADALRECTRTGARTVWSHKSPLNIAASRGFARLLKELAVPQISNPQLSHLLNEPDRYGRTPLISAVSHRGCQLVRLDIVRILLSLNVDIRRVDKDGNTALHVAAKHGHAQIVELLLDHNPLSSQHHLRRSLPPDGRQEPSPPEQAVPFHSSTSFPRSSNRSSRQQAFVRLVDMQNADGFTALHIASALGWTGVVQHLLDHGASTTSSNDADFSGSYIMSCPRRSTPLHLAAAQGNVWVAKAIVNAHNRRNQDTLSQDPRLLRDGNGRQPYMVAGHKGYWVCAQLLLHAIRDGPQSSAWQPHLRLAVRQEGRSQLPSLSSLASIQWQATLSLQIKHCEQTGEAATGAAAAAAAATVAVHMAQTLPGSAPIPACISTGGAGVDMGVYTVTQATARSHSPSAVTGHCLASAPMIEASLRGGCPVSVLGVQEREAASQMGEVCGGVALSADSSTLAEPEEVCDVCFERCPDVQLTSCRHRLCSTCTRGVVNMGGSRERPPLCPFCLTVVRGCKPHTLHPI